MEGKTAGVVRRYDVDSCPHQPKGQLVFTSRYLPWMGDDPKEIPFARATITSVRPGTVGAFRKDKMIAEQDGFENPAVWHGHLNQLYRGIADNVSVFHISFKIEEVDKNAGRQREAG
jgi:hypothetical protein